MDILKYEVYHKAFERTAVHVANVWINEDVPILEALEEVYRKTNNVEGSWSWGPTLPVEDVTNSMQFYQKYMDLLLPGPSSPQRQAPTDNGDYFENVEVVEPLRVDKDGSKWGHRSTSMDDYVVVDGKTYTCEACGWSCEGKEVA